ncbi:urease accessory protein UreD [bacterium]|nr:urease accessory protein UreD [bacterium]
MAIFHGQLALHATARPDDGVTTLSAQSVRAPFHLSKPYWDADTRTLLVQVVNPTAGILSGDLLESAVSVYAGASVLLTTPSATRVFRMRSEAPPASSFQCFKVAPGGWLEVLPEPLVPHRGSRFQQRTVLDVASGGGVFYADLLFPGRIAHGEAWAWERLVLELEVRSGPELFLRERLDQSADHLRSLAALAGAGEGASFGNAVFIAPESVVDTAPTWRAQLHALQAGGVWIGASQLRGGAGWSIKFVAPDGIRLRQTLAAIRRILASSAPHLACDARKL